MTEQDKKELDAMTEAGVKLSELERWIETLVAKRVEESKRESIVEEARLKEIRTVIGVIVQSLENKHRRGLSGTTTLERELSKLNNVLCGIEILECPEK